MRYAFSSRAITACTRAGLPSVSVSRAPRARSAAIVLFVSSGRDHQQRHFGGDAVAHLRHARQVRVVGGHADQQFGIELLECIGQVGSAGIQVQCAGMPWRRSRLLSASTGSRELLTTTSGTAADSDNAGLPDEQPNSSSRCRAGLCEAQAQSGRQRTPEGALTSGVFPLAPGNLAHQPRHEVAGQAWR